MQQFGKYTSTNCYYIQGTLLSLYSFIHSFTLTCDIFHPILYFCQKRDNLILIWVKCNNISVYSNN